LLLHFQDKHLYSSVRAITFDPGNACHFELFFLSYWWILILL